RRAKPASPSASCRRASRTTSWADGGSGGRGGRRSTKRSAPRTSRNVKLEPPPSPIRSARISPEPSPCSSRDVRTRSRIRSGCFVVSTAVRSYSAMARRRLYLMRHAEVSYFGEDGAPVNPAVVPLNEEGVAQARAAAEAFAGIELDRVVTSGLPRTLETAAIVAPGQEAESWPELREIQGGRLSEIPADALEREFVGAFRGVIPNETRFLRGESI